MNIPLSLYIHIPWCVRKCPYCDFNSHEVTTSLQEKEYVEALALDLAEDAHLSEGRQIESIFIGGGTPSLFSPDSIRQILVHVQDLLVVAPDAEVTLEANPGTLTEGASRLRGFVEAGVNRISIGAQSFTPRHLEALGRIHTADEAHKAFEFARQAGFSNINIDVMHGLPDQDLASALFDLNTAIALSPEHISWYQLTIEPNTVFFNRPPRLPDEDTEASIFEGGSALLAARGYQRYEISAFARPGRRSHHNLNYWQFGDYLGIGAGAHGKLTREGVITRTRKTRLPRDYLSSRRRHFEQVAVAQLPLEFLMNALRLCDGFSLAMFEARTGLASSVLGKFLESSVRSGLLENSDSWIKPTERGLLYLDTLLATVESPSLITSIKATSHPAWPG